MSSTYFYKNPPNYNKIILILNQKCHNLLKQQFLGQINSSKEFFLFHPKTNFLTLKKSVRIWNSKPFIPLSFMMKPFKALTYFPPPSLHSSKNKICKMTSILHDKKTIRHFIWTTKWLYFAGLFKKSSVVTLIFYASAIILNPLRKLKCSLCSLFECKNVNVNTLR